MKTLQDMMKDLTDITVEQEKINEYLENEVLDLRGADLQGADLRGADLKNIKITQQQLDKLTVIEENE
ncbi:pentapeptide repeat-containing protein [Spiroplasma citri]|uniref:Pentapeptide repeat-containing protein n=1 Tax=Spiroplasma citri TaxID=2133 RepID=A0AAX3SYL2_SPICI|nr:pentapeptide repeat-containing protein [Spiroplasma citri]WFG96370.1 pentapeptide repeat-containing protein [Spiroplasma citri]